MYNLPKETKNYRKPSQNVFLITDTIERRSRINKHSGFDKPSHRVLSDDAAENNTENCKSIPSVRLQSDGGPNSPVTLPRLPYLTPPRNPRKDHFKTPSSPYMLFGPESRLRVFPFAWCDRLLRMLLRGDSHETPRGNRAMGPNNLQPLISEEIVLVIIAYA